MQQEIRAHSCRRQTRQNRHAHTLKRAQTRQTQTTTDNRRTHTRTTNQRNSPCHHRASPTQVQSRARRARERCLGSILIRCVCACVCACLWVRVCVCTGCGRACEGPRTREHKRSRKHSKAAIATGTRRHTEPDTDKHRRYFRWQSS